MSSVRSVIDQLGETFATFDARTQDSGHVSYGIVDADGRRWFVKTSGYDGVSPGGKSREARTAVLREAAAIQDDLDHPALVPIRGVVEASDGIAVIGAWFDGELLRSPADRRSDPTTAYSRFRGLPPAEGAAALDTVIDLHVVLERAGWIAGDFYDGSLMYDFRAQEVRVIDLEAYHRGPYLNQVGRLPGSTRFMAPEEHQVGGAVTAATTVFNLGRMLDILLSARPPSVDALVTHATATDAAARPASVAELRREWRSVLPHEWTTRIVR